MILTHKNIIILQTHSPGWMSADDPNFITGNPFTGIRRVARSDFKSTSSTKPVWMDPSWKFKGKCSLNGWGKMYRLYVVLKCFKLRLCNLHNSTTLVTKKRIQYDLSMSLLCLLNNNKTRECLTLWLAAANKLKQSERWMWHSLDLDKLKKKNWY